MTIALLERQWSFQTILLHLRLCAHGVVFVAFSFVFKSLEDGEQYKTLTVTTQCALRLRPRTHGNVFLRFCIVYCSQGNREHATSSLLETIQKRRKTQPCCLNINKRKTKDLCTARTIPRRLKFADFPDHISIDYVVTKPCFPLKFSCN